MQAKPIEMLKAQGSYRPSRHPGKSAPKGKPRPPARLKGRREELAAFRQLVQLLESEGRASPSHSEVIALAAARIVEIQRLTEEIDAHGFLVDTPTTSGGTMLRLNPASTARDRAMRHLQSLLGELGLTPISVGRVQGGAKRDEDDSWSEFLQ